MTSLEPTFLSDVAGNTQWLDGGAMFGNVPRAVWQGWSEVDAAGRIPLACRALLIEHGGQRVLCETGIGAFFPPKLAERYGVMENEHILLRSLAALGLGESDIDAVVLSHLHFDHAGGLLPTYAAIAAGHDGLLFPRARYLVGRTAFARACQPHLRDRASFIPGMVDKLRASGRLELIGADGQSDLWPDRLSFRFSEGHTPGQMHAVFRGDQQTVVFCGDLVPGQPWVHLPVTMGYDRYPERLIDEKSALYSVAVPESWLLFFTHDQRIAAATLQQEASGRYAPAKVYPVLRRHAI